MFKLHDINDIDAIKLTRSHSPIVNQCENKIGYRALLKSLREKHMSPNSIPLELRRQITMVNGTVYTGNFDAKFNHRESFGV